MLTLSNKDGHGHCNGVELSQHINQNLHRAILYHSFPLEQSVPESRIRGNDSRDGFRSRADPQHFSTLPPIFQKLGYSSARTLRRQDPLWHCRERLQCRHRPNHHYPTNANDLGSTDGHAEKNRAHSCLCSWLHVCGPVCTPVLIEADLHTCSICLLTIVRLQLYVNRKVDDYTFGIAKIDIVTVMEPLLSIIVACFPVFPPALRRFTSYIKSNNSETRNVLSSSMVRSRLKRSDHSTFQKFDDSFLLTDLEENRFQTKVTGPSSKPGPLMDGCSQFGGVRTLPKASITIKQDWEVRSDKA